MIVQHLYVSVLKLRPRPQFLHADYLIQQSKKFDDLCSEFTLHEDLDYAEPYAIADIDTATGNIVNLRMRTKRRRTVGFIPITVPSTLTVSCFTRSTLHIHLAKCMVPDRRR